MILNDGNLTIVSSVEGGKLSYTDTVGGNFISNTITNRGTLTLKSGRVENMSSSAVADAGFPYAIDTSIWGAASEVVINIEGGEVYCESYSALRLRADSETERVDINITGGKVYGRIEVQNPSSNKATVGKLTISGGEIYKNNSSKAIMIFGGGGTAENMEVAITGGTITGAIGYSSYFQIDNFNENVITGGTFTENVSDFCADGYTVVENADGTYGVKEMPEIPTATVAPVINPAILFGLTFNADAITEEQLAFFGDWFADFTIVFNKDMVLNADGSGDGWLAGQYDEFGEGWVKVPFDDLVIEANKTYKVMELAAQIMGNEDFKITYADVVNFVKEFNCGVHLSDEFIAANPDFSVEIGLSIFNPVDETIEIKAPCTDAEGNTMQTVFTKDDIKRVVAEIDGTYYTTLADALAAAQTGDTITLLEDVNESVTISGNVTITLDLNGKKVSSSEDDTVIVKNGATVTIKNGTLESSARNRGGVYVNNATAILENSTFIGTNTEKAYGIYATNNANVTIKNCEAYANINADSSWAIVLLNAKVTVESGTFTAEHSISSNGSYDNADLVINGGTFAGQLYWPSNGTLTINGGEIEEIYAKSGSIKINNGTIGLLKVENVDDGGYEAVSKVAISGGTFNSYEFTNFSTSGIIAISGGIFGIPVAEEYCSEGYTPVANNDGTYGVKEMPEIPTATVAPVINPNILFGLTFNADAITEEQLAFFGDWFADFTIVFNKDMVLNADGSGDGWLAGQYDEFGEGWVKVPFDDLVIEANKTYKVMELAAQIMGNEDFKITYADVVNFVKEFNCGVHLSDEFIAANPDFSVEIGLSIFNPVDETIEIKAPCTDAEGNTMQTVFTKDDIKRVVAEIDGTYYTTLADALAALKAGDTLTLLADAEISTPIEVTSDLTIDGNGHKITYTGSSRAITVESAANGANLTIKNLTVDCTASYCERGINYNTNGTLTLNGVTVKGTNVSYAINLPGSSNGAEVEINNSNISGYGALNIWGEGVTVNVNNSTLHGHNNNTGEGNAFFVIVLNSSANDTTVNVNGGKIIASRGDGCEEMGVGRITSENGVINISETTVIENNGGYETLIHYGVARLSSGGICLTLQDAIESAKAGDTITLLRDVTISESIVITKDLTIDGNGHKITVTGAYGIDIQAAEVDLVINNLTIESNLYALNMRGASDNSTVEINNSNLIGCIALNVWGENVEITATDSNFTSVDNATHENYSAVKLNNNGTVSAEGTIITITGGSIIARDENGNPTSAATNATATGKINISDTTVVIGEINEYVAVVVYEGYSNFYGYFALKDAINKATNDPTATVKLLRDIEVSEALVINGNVKIDLNGKKVTLVDATKEVNCVFSIENGTVSITNGTIVTDNGQAIYAGVDKDSSYAPVITLENVTLEGAEFGLSVFGGANVTLGDKVVISGSVEALRVWNNATVTVNAGAEITCTGNGEVARAIAVYESASVSIVGGTITGIVDKIAGTIVITGGLFSLKPDAAYLANGYVAVMNDDNMYAICEMDLPEDIQWYDVSISLENSLKINYYLLSNSIYDGYTYYARVIKHHDTGCNDHAKCEVTYVPMSKWEIGDTYTRISVDGLAAKDMACQVEIQIFVGEMPEEGYSIDHDNSVQVGATFGAPEGSASVSLTGRYSILQYSKDVLASSKPEHVAIKPLIADLLRYGKAAQEYFGHYITKTAEDGTVTPVYVTDGVDLSAYPPVYDRDVTNRLKWHSGDMKYYLDFTLSLEDTIYLNFYFQNLSAKGTGIADFDANKLKAHVTFNHYDGKEHDVVYTVADGSLVLDDTNGKAVIVIDDLAPADLFDLVHVELFYDDQTLAEFDGSADSYCAIVFNNPSASEDLAAVCDTIVALAEKAEEYFNNKSN